MSAIASGLQWFVNLGASVMLPILLFIFALILRIKPSKAFKAGLMVGIGFIGLNLVISLLTKNLGPASHAMVRNFGILTLVGRLLLPLLTVPFWGVWLFRLALSPTLYCCCWD
jgi:PTS system galactitol-specific IIC component